MRERLADLAHRQWARWMVYLFSKCNLNDDGSMTIPRWAVQRWMRQVKADYAQLTEVERESDRKEADLYIEAFIAGIKGE